MMNEKRILIVEDEVSLAHILESKIQAAGMKVTVAENGEVALKELKKDQYDLILLDLVMPELDGFGVLEEMQSKGVNTPVIVLSNLGQDEDIKKAMDRGAKSYFVKSSIVVSDVISEIQKILK